MSDLGFVATGGTKAWPSLALHWRGGPEARSGMGLSGFEDGGKALLVFALGGYRYPRMPMNFEYFAPAVLDEAQRQALLEELQQAPHLELLPSSDPERAPFNLILNLRRFRCPEDLEIQFREDGIFVAFYSAKAHERAGFLWLLQSSLRSLGVVCSFRKHNAWGLGSRMG